MINKKQKVKISKKSNKMDKCQSCSKNNGTGKLHDCPYQCDINNNHTPWCNCCDECYEKCIRDIYLFNLTI